VLLTQSQQRQRVRLTTLTAEIDALRRCMNDVYERSGSLTDPFLMQLSEILDRRLNEFAHLLK
jgi:ribosomal protein S4